MEIILLRQLFGDIWYHLCFAKTYSPSNIMDLMALWYWL